MMDPYRIQDEEPSPISEMAWDALRNRMNFKTGRVEVLATPCPSGMDWGKYLDKPGMNVPSVGVADGENHVVPGDQRDRGDDGTPGDGD